MFPVLFPFLIPPFFRSGWQEKYSDSTRTVYLKDLFIPPTMGLAVAAYDPIGRDLRSIDR
jgi:hypothetical protein